MRANELRPLIKYNDVSLLVPLSRNMFSIIDAADADLVSSYNWQARPQRNCENWYAYRATRTKGEFRNIALHRVIVGLTERGLVVDHINGNGLDNRRANLRICTRTENAANRRASRNSRLGFKGVTFVKNCPYRPWRATIYPTVSLSRRFHLGYFATAEDAARAYDKKAQEIFGEFAKLNFPGEAA